MSSLLERSSQRDREMLASRHGASDWSWSLRRRQRTSANVTLRKC